jgi:hypothetical protein
MTTTDFVPRKSTAGLFAPPVRLMSPEGSSPQTLAQLTPAVQVADCTAKKGLLVGEEGERQKGRVVFNLEPRRIKFRKAVVLVIALLLLRTAAVSIVCVCAQSVHAKSTNTESDQWRQGMLTNRHAPCSKEHGEQTHTHRLEHDFAELESVSFGGPAAQMTFGHPLGILGSKRIG